jgi:hypothetical protein
MFRLIKLAAYAAIGYALYELFQGMTAESGMRARGSASNRNLRRALDETGGRMQTLTGPEGQGMRESTLDPDGGSVPHRVGRGVRTV